MNFSVWTYVATGWAITLLSIAIFYIWSIKKPTENEGLDEE